MKSNVVTVMVTQPPPPAGAAGATMVLTNANLPQYCTNPEAQAWIQAFANAGVSWVMADFDNLTASTPQNLSLLDTVVSAIRSSRMKLVLRFGIPGREAAETPVPTLATIISEGVTNMGFFCSRYSPDMVIAIYEVSSWSNVLKQTASVTQWQAWADQLAQAAKAATPGVPVGVSGTGNLQPLEVAFLTRMSSDPNVDGIGAHLYSTTAQMNYANNIFPLARSGGKFIYSDEAWTTGLHGVITTIAEETGDIKWLDAIWPYVSRQGLKFLSPFFTEAFFYYAPTTQTVPQYLANVASAVLAGQTTSTYAAYKALITAV